MSNALEVKFKFPRLDERVKKNATRINQFVAAAMQTNRALLFDAEGAYSGHRKWAPLKFREGQILSKSGKLRKSIGPGNDGKRPVKSDGGIVKFTNGIVKIGTNLAYASIQNYGGVIKAKNKLALKIPLEKGVMFRKKVTIPARPFNDITQTDAKEFNDALKAIVVEVIQHG